MTCRDTEKLLELEGRGGLSSSEQQALDRHLEACDRCADVARVARLSVVLLGALREEIAPAPAFYARLRARMAAEGTSKIETTLLQAWGFARRLVPALALGVLLLAVSISLTGPRSPHAGLGRGIYAFSLEELNLPAAVERPSQDQMLAFVLMRDSDGESGGRDAR
jgi:anti-sigma factor RsiW